MTSGEGGQSQESELIDSVHLTCSEDLNEVPDSAGKQDSLALINMIDKVAKNEKVLPSVPTNSDENLSSTRFLAPNTNQSATAKTEKGNSSKKSSSAKKTNSAKGTTESGRKRTTAPFQYSNKASLSQKHGTTSFALRTNSQKENLNLTPQLSKESKEVLSARQMQKSLKLLTPQLNKSNQSK